MSNTPEVSEALTRKLAHLSRLKLTDEEVRIFTAQLGDVLSYVELLQKVDVEGIEPMRHAFAVDSGLVPFREDIVVDSPVDDEGKPRVLTNSPDIWEDAYRVPQIL